MFTGKGQRQEAAAREPDSWFERHPHGRFCYRRNPPGRLNLQVRFVLSFKKTFGDHFSASFPVSNSHYVFLFSGYPTARRTPPMTTYLLLSQPTVMKRWNATLSFARKEKW